jgi:hypothetical protein
MNLQVQEVPGCLCMKEDKVRLRNCRSLLKAKRLHLCRQNTVCVRVANAAYQVSIWIEAAVAVSARTGIWIPATSYIALPVGPR